MPCADALVVVVLVLTAAYFGKKQRDRAEQHDDGPDDQDEGIHP